MDKSIEQLVNPKSQKVSNESKEKISNFKEKVQEVVDKKLNLSKMDTKDEEWSDVKKELTEEMKALKKKMNRNMLEEFIDKLKLENFLLGFQTDSNTRIEYGIIIIFFYVEWFG